MQRTHSWASAIGLRRDGRGFTLIELMITVAVIGILSAIAYPSYRESVAKGRRAQMTSLLSTANQWMERFYAENYRYDQNTAGVSVNDPTMFPIFFPQSPPKPDTAMYTFSVNAGQNTMVLKATAVGGMSSDKCGDYSIDQLGVKVVSGSANFATPAAALAYCWR